MVLNKLLCPITGEELIYVGHDIDVYDGNSYYSPKNDSTIIFAVHPRRNNIYAQVEDKSFMSKDLRWFQLLDDNTWQELKQVPYDNRLFPIDDEGEEWIEACRKAEEEYQKRLEKEEYWKQHPEEDPRVHFRTIGIDKVEVRPMGPPIGVLNYIDFKYNAEEKTN